MSIPLKSDRLRAALDAYSEVLSEREQSGRTFTNGDHRRAMQAALDAADTAVLTLIDEATAEVRATAEPGWEFAPDEPPLQALTRLRERLTTQQPQTSVEDSIDVSAAEVAEMVRTLNTERIQALRIMGEMTPKFGSGVVPLGRFVHGATASALYRRALIAQRSTPLVGYVFTTLGRAVLDALTEPTPKPERSQGTSVGDTPQGALTIHPLGAPLLGLTESRVREAGASALRLSAKQQQALLQILDAVGGPVGGDAGLIVPFNVVHHGTRRSLVTFGMLRDRVDGVQFTDFGLAAAQYLRKHQS